MNRLRFTKMQGAGNDFVVIDATQTPFDASPERLRRLADRRFGVGCDQILLVEPPGAPGVDFDYRIFNADGSEVGQCGNGARCLARFVHHRGLTAKSRLKVRTQSRVLELVVDDAGIRVNLGEPRFAPAEIPLGLPPAEVYALTLPAFGEIRFRALSMGNPHAVIEVAEVDTAPVATLGPALQAHPAFPASVNVGFLQIEGRQRGRLRVFERGVGETLACGSGACAAAVAGMRAGHFDRELTLDVPGGRLGVSWEGPGQGVWLRGPAEIVFEGEMRV